MPFELHGRDALRWAALLGAVFAPAAPVFAHDGGGGAPETAAVTLSRKPLVEDRGWHAHVLAIPGTFATPRKVTIEGDAAAVSHAQHLVSGAGKRTTLTTTGAAYRMSWERGAMAPGIGASVKKTLRTPGPWRIFMSAEGEMLPRWENRMTLHPTRKDRWDMPLVHLDVAHSENEKRMAAQAEQDIRQMLQAAGCQDAVVIELNAPGAAIADAGTAVMGRDRKTSVLNEWNQVHGVPNVLVTDGSCLASNGNPSSPSLTFMALTARAVNHAVELVKQNKL